MVCTVTHSSFRYVQRCVLPFHHKSFHSIQQLICSILVWTFPVFAIHKTIGPKSSFDQLEIRKLTSNFSHKSEQGTAAQMLSGLQRTREGTRTMTHLLLCAQEGAIEKSLVASSEGDTWTLRENCLNIGLLDILPKHHPSSAQFNPHRKAPSSHFKASTSLCKT